MSIEIGYEKSPGDNDMKKLLLILIITVLTTTLAEGRGNQPCSGKKGGVASCRSDGKFICKNRSISKSKRRCGARLKNQKPKNSRKSQRRIKNRSDK